MSQKRELPSKWWFWGIPALANFYLVLVVCGTVALGLTAPFTYRWIRSAVADLLYLPWFAFGEHVAGPVLSTVFGERVTDAGLSRRTFALTLGLWERWSSLLGAVVYGSALLWAALTGGKAKGTEGEV